jgi:hypothetical protein
VHIPPRLPQVFLSAVSPLRAVAVLRRTKFTLVPSSFFWRALPSLRAGTAGHLRHGKRFHSLEDAYAAAPPTVVSSLLSDLQGFFGRAATHDKPSHAACCRSMRMSSLYRQRCALCFKVVYAT